MPPQPHPYVASATITGGKITFRVEVTGFSTTDGLVEISGQATQVNGAFAPIYAFAEVPFAPNGDPDDPEERDRYFVDVEANPTPERPFEEGQDVTVFVRASKVWVTVLGPGTDDPEGTSPRTASAGPTWGKRRAQTTVGWDWPDGEPV